MNSNHSNAQTVEKQANSTTTVDQVTNTSVETAELKLSKDTLAKMKMTDFLDKEQI